VTFFEITARILDVKIQKLQKKQGERTSIGFLVAYTVTKVILSWRRKNILHQAVQREMSYLWKVGTYSCQSKQVKKRKVRLFEIIARILDVKILITSTCYQKSKEKEFLLAFLKHKYDVQQPILSGVKDDPDEFILHYKYYFF
jgi:hypothetical protein